MSSAEFPDREPDILVVGAGNAALCAAISAHDNGARVQCLKPRLSKSAAAIRISPAGAFRFAFAGMDDLIAVLPSLAQANLETVDFAQRNGAHVGSNIQPTRGTQRGAICRGRHLRGWRCAGLTHCAPPPKFEPSN
jgi:hypothetical protein